MNPTTRGRSKTLIEKWESKIHRKVVNRRSVPIFLSESIVSKLIPHFNNLNSYKYIYYKLPSFREYQSYYQISEPRHIPSFRTYQKLYPLEKSNKYAKKKIQRLSKSNPIVWKQVMSQEGLYYYWNTQTNITQYEKPDQFQPIDMF